MVDARVREFSGIPMASTGRDLAMQTSFLSDAELARYGEIVADQKRLEWKHGLWQRVCAFGAGFVLLGAVWVAWAGHGFWAWAPLGLAGLVMGYWPYRKAKVRRLWDGHLAAVAVERQRRSDPAQLQRTQATVANDDNVPAMPGANGTDG